jgi:hypothetical protein
MEHSLTNSHYSVQQDDFVVRETKKGKGVFAGRDFTQGVVVCVFQGEIIRGGSVPEPYDDVDDHYVQIGKDLYMGPSGGIDDLFNHSCDPNTGLKVEGNTVTLIAIRDIKKGDEVVWDYSTTMDETEWEMDCTCGSVNCRKRIRDFRYLPKNIQDKYINLGIVPNYILPSLK